MPTRRWRRWAWPTASRTVPANFPEANAALFAVALLANHDERLRAELDAFRARQTEAARAMELTPLEGQG